jgi:hypothetical protein
VASSLWSEPHQLHQGGAGSCCDAAAPVLALSQACNVWNAACSQPHFCGDCGCCCCKAVKDAAEPILACSAWHASAVHFRSDIAAAAAQQSEPIRGAVRRTRALLQQFLELLRSSGEKSAIT